MCQSQGFHAFVGNPPFLGGKRISSELGTAYERLLKILYQAKGAADLVCYFFRTAFQLVIKDIGYLGLLSTNSIREGDSPEIGLGEITRAGGVIYWAKNSFPWPGEAGVFITQIHIAKGKYEGKLTLDGRPATHLTHFLDDESSLAPLKLCTRLCVCSAGRQLYGDGFIITQEQKHHLLADAPTSSSVLRPYYNADLFNKYYGQEPSVWAIDFGNMDFDSV